MSELIDDILFLSELESGRQVVSLGSTPVLPVLEEVRDRLANSAEHADVRVLIDADSTVDLPLRRRMLQVVAENLAENSIRYAGNGATLTLRARAGLFEAADDGRGLEEEDLPRLFERFYRVEKSRNRAHGGAGIGLAIVKQLVEATGGRVGAESQGGVTRFWFSLPA